MNSDPITRLIKKHIAEIELIYLFGSQARKDATPESDFDFAVRGAATLSIDKRLELASGLSALVKGDVDVLDLREASTVMQVQVLKDGKLLYFKSALLRDEFEMYALSDYVRLNEERAGIISDFYSDKNKK